MAKSYEPDDLMARIFFIVCAGIGVQILAFAYIGFF